MVALLDFVVQSINQSIMIFSVARIVNYYCYWDHESGCFCHFVKC